MGKPDEPYCTSLCGRVADAAEALIQLNDGRIAEAVSLINEVRNRAKQSTAMISDYPARYNVNFNVQPYNGTYSQEESFEDA